MRQELFTSLTSTLTTTLTTVMRSALLTKQLTQNYCLSLTVSGLWSRVNPCAAWPVRVVRVPLYFLI